MGAKLSQAFHSSHLFQICLSTALKTPPCFRAQHARTGKSNAPQPLPAPALIPVLQKWVENTADRGLCCLGQQWTGTERIPGWLSGWCAPPAPCHWCQTGSCPVPRWAAGCSHNSLSPRPAGPATQTQQNPAVWVQSVLRTAPQAVTKYRKWAVWVEKWGKNPGSLEEEGERSWMIKWKVQWPALPHFGRARADLDCKRHSNFLKGSKKENKEWNLTVGWGLKQHWELAFYTSCNKALSLGGSGISVRRQFLR